MLTSRLPAGRQARSLALWALIGAFASAPFSNSIFEIFSSVYLVLGIFLLFSDKRLASFRNTLTAIAFLYLVVTAISAIQSIYPENAWKGLFRVFRCVLMCFLAPVVCDTEKKFHLVFRAISVTALLIGLDALFQAAFGFDLIRQRGMTTLIHGTGRVTGPFNHTNDFSAYLCLVFFLFLGNLDRVLKKKDAREIAFTISGALILTLCVLWTYSRGAWLSIGAAWFAMALFKRDRFSIGILLVGVVLLLILAPQNVRTRFTTLWKSNDGTMIERRLLWKESIDMTVERPWFGHGINTYSKVEPRFKSKDIYTDNQYAHNGYLQIAAETGVLGLGSFLLFILFFFRQTLYRFSGPQGDAITAAVPALLFGIFAFLLHSTTDTDLQSLRLVSSLWLFMGVALAAKKLLRERIS